MAYHGRTTDAQEKEISRRTGVGLSKVLKVINEYELCLSSKEGD